MKTVLLVVLIAGVVIAFSVCSAVAQEEMTVTSYYPAPEGYYNQVQANSVAVGSGTPVSTTNGELRWGGATSRGMLSINNGASIELGGPGTAPYIDFSRNATIDYHARIWLQGANTFKFLVGGGGVEIRDIGGASWRDITVRDIIMCS